jgi:hypothetical protein
MDMRKTVLLLFCMAVAMAVVVAGCSDTPDQNVGKKKLREKPKTVVVKEKSRTVVVNEGLSKKEEEALNERLDKLEKKVDSQDEKDTQGTVSPPAESSQPEESQPQQTDDQARAAAESERQRSPTIKRSLQGTGDTSTAIWTPRHRAHTPSANGSRRTTGSQIPVP